MSIRKNVFLRNGWAVKILASAEDNRFLRLAERLAGIKATGRAPIEDWHVE